MKIRYLYIITIVLMICFSLYTFYKTKVLKKAIINNNYYLEYVDVDLNAYFLNENFEDTSIVKDRRDVTDVSGLFVDKNQIFLFDENQQYYIVNKEKLEVKKISSNDSFIVDNKKSRVDNINYKSPFWFIVFN